MTIRYMLAGASMALLSMCHPAHADTCLTSLDQTTTQSTIGRLERVNVDTRQITRVNNEIGKCSVNIQGYDGANWYPGTAEYWFTPDLAANEACEKAVQRAKMQIIDSIFPHRVDSTTSLTCRIREGKIVERTKPIDKEYWTMNECRTVKYRKNIGYGTPPQCIKLYPWKYRDR